MHGFLDTGILQAMRDSNRALHFDCDTVDPTEQPSEEPTEQPSEQPSEQPTQQPSWRPTEEPSMAPTLHAVPTEQPSEQPIERVGTFVGGGRRLASRRYLQEEGEPVLFPTQAPTPGCFALQVTFNDDDDQPYETWGHNCISLANNAKLSSVDASYNEFNGIYDLQSSELNDRPWWSGRSTDTGANRIFYDPRELWWVIEGTSMRLTTEQQQTGLDPECGSR